MSKCKQGLILHTHKGASAREEQKTLLSQKIIWGIKDIWDPVFKEGCNYCSATMTHTYGKNQNANKNKKKR